MRCLSWSSGRFQVIFGYVGIHLNTDMIHAVQLLELLLLLYSWAYFVQEPFITIHNKHLFTLSSSLSSAVTSRVRLFYKPSL